MLAYSVLLFRRISTVALNAAIPVCVPGVNGDQNPTPDGGVDQKCETIRVLQNCSVLVVDGIDGGFVALAMLR
jgi:hypothetical protein